MPEAVAGAEAPPLKTTNISVVDLGVGNIGSVLNMLRYLGARPTVVDTVDDLDGPSKVMLPGVGHWDHAAARLDRDGWRSALTHVADVQRRPVLGVCLGMQLLLEKSAEGDLPGLGLVPGHVAPFDLERLGGTPLRVPHMGWNVVTDAQPNELSPGDDVERRFYFAHSYHAQDVPPENSIMRTHYGYDFVCGVRRDKVWGVQFHPEKSHKFGMRLLREFLAV